MAAYRRVYDSRHLHADQLRNPTLGNRVWATFFIKQAVHFGSVRSFYRTAPTDTKLSPRQSLPPADLVHFYELGGAGMLFANNQRCRNAITLRAKALQPLKTSKHSLK